MANMQPHIEIVLKIPLKQTAEFTKDGKVQLRMRATTAKASRFLLRLKKLCRKYGFKLNAVQLYKEGQSGKADNCR